jgi:hypothetical protein
MKKLLLSAVLLCSISSLGHAQSRNFGAHSIILDNGGSPTYRLTLQADPAMTGDATFTFPATGGTVPGNGTLEGQTLRWDNTGLVWQPSSLLTNTGTRLGFGTSTPVFRYHVRDTQASSTASFVSQTVTTGSAINSANYGGYFDVIAEGTGTFVNGPLGLAGRSTINRGVGNDVPLATGVLSSIDHLAGGTIADAKSMNAQLNNAVGTMTKATALKATIFNQAQIDSLFGLHIMGPINTGTITAMQAIKVDEIPGSAAANLVFRYDHATNPVQIDNNGKLRFGPTTSILGVDRIELNSSTTSNAQVVGAYGRLSVAPTGAATGSRYGLAYEVYANDGGTMTSARASGVSGGSLTNRTTGDVQQLTGVVGFGGTGFPSTSGLNVASGVSGQALHQGSGTLVDAAALRATTFMLGTGPMTNSYGLKVEPIQVTGSGTITNAYGVYLSELTQGTNNTAILYDHGTKPFILTGDGKVGVGTSTPQTRLDIVGDVAMRSAGTYFLPGSGPYLLGGTDIGYVEISADPGGSTLAGLQSGQDGKISILYSTGAGDLTITNEDGGVTDADRIHTMTGADIVTSGEAAITLIYNASIDRWIVLSVQD